ncbi:hypothetical protein [Magnetospirillum fulvum]|uniref:Capsule polysaccharide biosynthesis protein n=1 Tax=Magnetospirillum fulvum MGU-K5 TaxID=1316936 RepID=S9THG7_MAGFU|nr:hypothetical protein [Magnetospirillum fulvum]EPY01721.1 hypothetical protein K678_09363 [Magnetospirillum fulvum MGU-K5]
MTRAFLIECSGAIWSTIADHLTRTHGWDISLWTGAAADRDVVLARFRETHFVANTDAALDLGETAWPKAIVDALLLSRLSPVEGTAIRMMDRLDLAATFTHADRYAHFLDLVRTWAGALDHYHPDVVVFSNAPHVIFDYVLYALCQMRGIPTPMFERHGLPGWVFLQQSIEGPPLRGYSDAPLPAVYDKWLSVSMAGGKSAIPPNFQKKAARYKLNSGNASLFRALVFECSRAAYLFKRYGFAGPANSYLRSPRTGERASWLETEAARFAAIFRKRHLARVLARLTSLPLDNEPYVLLALHYQPERATLPMSGLYGDQLLVIDLLSRLLPPGWKLYVKEHPWQLQPFSRGEMCRNAAFYRRIAAHANVRLLPMAVDSAPLIAGAKAIATGTGSMGWQGLCLGIPALVFGAAWYRTCPGVFEIKSAQDIEMALATIASGGAAPSPKQIRCYLSMVAESCIPGVLEPDVEATGGLDLDRAATGMADALAATQH